METALTVILATGPSLTQADVDYCRGRAYVIAIKDALRLAPWADVLYSAEVRWWRAHGPTLPAMTAGQRRFAVNPEAAPFGATVLAYGTESGLSLKPNLLHTGRHSGYSAINLAVQLGAKRIVLLGYDMQPSAQGATHFFGEHTYQHFAMQYEAYRAFYPTLVEPLRQIGVEVLNASRASAIDCFPRVALADALASVPA